MSEFLLTQIVLEYKKEMIILSDHAILSPSSLKRWLTCTPSAQLEKRFENHSSKYAVEESFAHALAELLLRMKLELIRHEIYVDKLQEMKQNEYFSQELLEYVLTYVDFAQERIAEFKDPLVLIKHCLDYSNWVPEGLGTADLIILTDNKLQVVEVKFRKDMYVEAEGNIQMRLYALGAIQEFGDYFDIQSVRITIFQPRLNNTWNEDLKIWDLLKWADEYVKPRADLAIKGKGEFVAGEHCRFSQGKSICKSEPSSILSLARIYSDWWKIH